ncbi:MULTISPECIES: chemotaxis-specific protein-glutamate methyltransferase CheB [Novosphingobium]|uniref:chemotaxis-specific protein-glutamate methyltransferase CheB n=1 Tax=Novosphingobium TaxID=165696 RepID=UPI001CD26A0B|nr:chemotaxis-specific protein-glutamate methyltransferase CheB [Novosphingobium percolationis]
MKALVVDDSALMRRQIGDILTRGGFEVVTARTGAEALARAHEERPSVVTLDINMPEMDGLTCLSRLMAECPAPVVMISSLTEEGALATLEAIALGAVDFVHKPGGTVSTALREQEDLIIAKVKAAVGARVRRSDGLRQRLVAKRETILRNPTPARGRIGSFGPGNEALTLVGASTGGPAVLEDVLGALSADYPMPVLVCQHMPATVTRHFAERLDQCCALRVEELRRQTELEAGTIYLARGDADMVVMERGGRLMATIAPPSRDFTWHPSMSRLVASALRTLTPDSLIGVLLTGMGDDGAAELAELRRQGGHTIAESEDSCVVYGMPRALIERGGADEVLHGSQIGARLERVAFTRMRSMRGGRRMTWAS